MKKINITFTDGSPVSLDRDGIIKVPTVRNTATIELTEPVSGSGADPLLAVCFSCDRSKVDTKPELRRLGWYLTARFELCPNHAGDVFSAWARFDREITEAF